MKMMCRFQSLIQKKLSILIMLTAGFMLTCAAQGTPELNAFYGQENNGNVLLSWEISSGSVCSGTRIHRSSDGTHFTRIGEIYGVCGSLTVAVSYNFTDTVPVGNSFNYYRLEFGDGDFSEAISVEVRSLNSEGYQLRVDSERAITDICFSNKEQKQYMLSIYTMQGMEVFRDVTTADLFRVDAAAFPSQVLVFLIVSEENPRKVISGKLAIVR